MVEKNPRKRGLAKLPWTEQRDLFRDMSQRRREQYAAEKARVGAIISKKESEKCLDPLRSEEVVISVQTVDLEEKLNGFMWSSSLHLKLYGSLWKLHGCR